MVQTTRDTSNIMFNIAADLVNQSSRNIFLTGKAGTGKTTFLKYIRENCYKQMAVVAPTGVAAINAGGVTIHSFFQLPFTPFIPVNGDVYGREDVADAHSLLGKLKLTGDKKKLMRELELLIIDEISMVRCDVLDAIDAVLRHVRQRRIEPFGGVQLLFIGDMFQLPPVVPEQEWRVLSGYYESPYFFDSKVLREFPPVYIEFSKIYRQSEENFIRLLNQVRNNELDAEGMRILDGCYDPHFQQKANNGYIILTTHNRKADTINEGELAKINGRTFSFNAAIEGEFPEKSFPADEKLVLKCGAQVMFIKNDPDKAKRYFNGKIGVVARIEEEKIVVLCDEQTGEVEVKKETWKNIRYTLDSKTRQVDEELLGSFSQFPLQLAWAITIHKSQGLTFEKAIIDAGEAFSPGQVYVALSRCTTLKGMVLQTKVRQQSLFTDKRILSFSEGSKGSDALLDELTVEKRIFELSVLQTVFGFDSALDNTKTIINYVKEHAVSFNDGTTGWLEQVLDRLAALEEVAGKFRQQLKGLYTVSPAGDDRVRERIVAGANFFRQKIEEVIDFLKQSPASSESRLHAREYNEYLKETLISLAAKVRQLAGMNNGFSMAEYQQRKKGFVPPSFSINAYAADTKERKETPHPSLYMQLKILRDSICSKANLPVYLVAGSDTLFEMSRYLPQSLAELKQISGFGDAKIERYGQGFLDIIVRYCQAKGLGSLMTEKGPKKQRRQSIQDRSPKPDTKEESFKLFKTRMSVNDIASERKLTVQTIEGHLAHYVKLGMINIDELLSEAKQASIAPVLIAYAGRSLTELKEKLGNDISYGEIRFAIAWNTFLNREEKD